MEDYGPGAASNHSKSRQSGFGLERGANIARKVKESRAEALTIENLDKFYDMPIVAGWDPATRL